MKDVSEYMLGMAESLTLGAESTAEIAQRLLVAGCKGIPRSAAKCPLAVFFKTGLRAHNLAEENDYVLVNTGAVSATPPVLPRAAFYVRPGMIPEYRGSITLPDILAQFAKEIDAGMYPALGLPS